MPTLTAQQEQDLESLIDGASLCAVVQALSRIAYEKSEHIASNWQDPGTASYWAHAAEQLDKCSTHFPEV